ncbi:MAG: flagellar protein FliS [Pseudomonadota bacterium]
MSLARNLYRQTAKQAPTNVQDPHEIVTLTLKELVKALSVLSLAQEQGRSYPAQPLNRALTAIYVLQSSLDFEAGGAIAQDLFQIYEFARHHALKAWRGEPEARLREAEAVMGDILEAWEAIGPQVRMSA